MNTLTQKMLTHFELLPDDMQNEVIDFVNFLIEKTKKQQSKILPDYQSQDLEYAIAEGLKSQVKDAEEVFNRLENKYKALADGVSL